MADWLPGGAATAATARLRNKLIAREPTIGSWLSIGSPYLAEIMARAGFEWLVVDMEHSGLSSWQAQHLIQVIDLAGVTPLVRVGANDPLLIKRALDVGAHGIIVPNVNSRADAESAVASSRYPARGLRGVGLARAHGFGLEFENYREWAQDALIVIVQIEHVDAVTNVDEILSVPGVDAFIVGPYDLSGSLGIPGRFDRPEFVQTLSRLENAMQHAKPAAGFHVVHSSQDAVRQKVAEGYSLIAYGTDMVFFAEKVRDELRATGHFF